MTSQAAHLAAITFAGALVAAMTGTQAAAASQVLPRAFHGTWGTDLAHCAVTGEERPTQIDGRFIIQYESGWTIRRWTRRGDIWVGRGTAGDEQNDAPATVRLRLRADGKLDFDGGSPGRFVAGPGWIRCPTKARDRQ